MSDDSVERARLLQRKARTLQSEIAKACDGEDPLSPGPALDTLVAEKVMGWRRVHETLAVFEANGRTIHVIDPKWERNGGRLWSPSTDIAAAWEVVEKLREKWLVMTSGPQATNHVAVLVYDLGAQSFGPGEIFTHISQKLQIAKQCHKERPDLFRMQPIVATAPSDQLPHAICLAALRAVGAIE